MAKTNSIADILLHWHTTIDRNMPWKQTKDPYKIWLSEIILQQTRVAQGQPYYLRFVDEYPTVADLAAASLDEVLNLWQGLGYYSRARNMHAAAQHVVDHHGGVFPSTYEEVIALKGVGKYTAAAIMSFAYGERYPVVDGNVLRVISRLYGILDAIDDSKTINKIYELSDAIIKHADPAKYNQAVMDAGATMCTPKQPRCSICPLQSICVAYKKGLTADIPYKAKKVKKRTRHFHYLHLYDEYDSIVLRHRQGAGIWQGLYDMPLVEKNTEGYLTDSEIETEAIVATGGTPLIEVIYPSKVYKHLLTHQLIYARFYRVKVQKLSHSAEGLYTVSKAELSKYAMPVLLTNYLSDSDITLF